MASSMKPIKLYGKGGPNPPKVHVLLEELGLPYEIEPVELSDVKSPAYVAINPNGRLPSIYDPNTDLTLWESGAIIEYLVERYDTEHRLSFAPGSNESFHAKQYLYFQVSGQGPYYGQAFWFKRFASEQIPFAIDRYVKEIGRVTGVLEEVLGQQKKKFGDGDGPWLVGNKCSYADLAFIPWQTIITMALSKEEHDADSYPNVKEWMAKMNAREKVKTVMSAAFSGH